MSTIFEKLVKNKRVIELVNVMKPLELAKAFSELGFSAHDASRAAIGLVKATMEDFAYPRVKSTSQYPSPPPKDPETVFPNEGTGNYNSMGHGDSTGDGQVPPKPRPEPQEWPYDGMTLQGMDPENKSGHKPMLNGVSDRQLDPTQKQPGIAGMGTQSRRSPHNISGQDWSHNPQNRDYDPPEKDF